MDSLHIWLKTISQIAMVVIGEQSCLSILIFFFLKYISKPFSLWLPQIRTLTLFFPRQTKAHFKATSYFCLSLEGRWLAGDARRPVDLYLFPCFASVPWPLGIRNGRLFYFILFQGSSTELRLRSVSYCSQPLVCSYDCGKVTWAARHFFIYWKWKEQLVFPLLTRWAAVGYRGQTIGLRTTSLLKSRRRVHTRGKASGKFYAVHGRRLTLSPLALLYPF